MTTSLCMYTVNAPCSMHCGCVARGLPVFYATTSHLYSHFSHLLTHTIVPHLQVQSQCSRLHQSGGW